MLATTVRSNLKDINNLKMRTKTTKFSRLFQTVPVIESDESEMRQVLMREGLVELPKDEDFEDITVVDVEDSEPEFDDIDITEEDDELYEIVEDPNELVVQLPVISDINFEERLPFFKSISLKLASL
ncbi:hypothetical protein IKL64_05620 [bacterium]|nr:hypothetical protein [bacterium]